MGWWCFLNSKKIQDESVRKIYVGDVPEVDEGQKEWSGRRTTRDSLSYSSLRRKSQDCIEQEGTISVRRRSSTTSKKNLRVSISRARERKHVNTVTEATERNIVFPDNHIKTSRYTIWTFIPKNLLEQFRRFVNFYFLVVTFLQYIIDSPESPVSSTFGFLFVICVTAVKQGYEDWIRHRADDAVNNRAVEVVIHGKLQTTKSKELKVGNIVRLEVEDAVPADILVLSSSDEFQRCQITTANLDGESNLKMRYCAPGLPKFNKLSDYKNFNGVIECEQPNANLYSFNGNLLLFKRHIPNMDSVRSKVSKLDEPSSSWSRRVGAAIKDSIRSRVSFKVPESEDEDGASTSEFLQIPLTMENLLLRGTKLKNTDYMYGLVVYTGRDTRLAQNSKKTSTKFPTADRSINTFMVLVMIFLAAIVTLYSALHFVWLRSDMIDAAWYLPPNNDIDALYVVETSFSFLVIFYYIVPLSLYVTIELQTFFGSMYFVWDEDMKCPQTGAPPLCNTSDLNEELGQIEYLFSDKTGTLTENVMEFRHCSSNGTRFQYDRKNHELRCAGRGSDGDEPVDFHDPKNEGIKHFLRTLALCHTVQVIKSEQQKRRISKSARKPLFKLRSKEQKLVDVQNQQLTSTFQANSPDELALLEACAALGIRFLGDQNETLTIDVCGSIETYKRHYVLEFDADRKCMSVILQNCKGEIWLLTKGADSTLLPNGVSGCISESNQHINEFAQLGLRTLAVAEKQLSAEDLRSFTKELNKVRRLVHNREEKMRDLYRTIETGLQVLGATGVEDRLQEGVQETLVALSEAGIRVWVLTGDKVETAINVAIACGLIIPTSLQLKITNFKSPEELSSHLQSIQSEGVTENTTFVIDGESLALALMNCGDLFCSLVMKGGRVVCCRMAPLQKAQVVAMVKNTHNKPITAAVGDGANDVAMIQEAHIGIGIFGKEGRQAARCADFAVARFSFLKKAILVHGHWYYVRLATLILYFFYKNVVLILPAAYSAFQTVFSSQSLFNAFFVTFFNIFFTSAPILAFALQEQPKSAETLLENPQLYRSNSRNKLLTWATFAVWIVRALWHSVAIYYIPFFSITQLNIADWSSYGILIYSGVVAVCNMMLIPYTKYFTKWNLFAFGCSFISYFVVGALYTEVDMRPLVDSGTLHHASFMVQSHPAFWLIMIILVILALVPDIMIIYKSSK